MRGKPHSFVASRFSSRRLPARGRGSPDEIETAERSTLRIQIPVDRTTQWRDDASTLKLTEGVAKGGGGNHADL